MEELISRTATIEGLLSIVEEKKEKTHWIEVLTMLEKLAAEQPEIVRCMDCRYFRDGYCLAWKASEPIKTRRTGYCYKGRRQRLD